MFAQERQESIVSQVNIEGSVRVKDLSVKFAVTEDCIRKDLAILEKRGLLKKRMEEQLVFAKILICIIVKNVKIHLIMKEF